MLQYVSADKQIGIKIHQVSCSIHIIKIHWKVLLGWEEKQINVLEEFCPHEE